MTNNHYTFTVNTTPITMNAGRYSLSYIPPEESEIVETTINMSISSEAGLYDMLSFFESFLLSAGYIFTGNLSFDEK